MRRCTSGSHRPSRRTPGVGRTHEPERTRSEPPPLGAQRAWIDLDGGGEPPADESVAWFVRDDWVRLRVLRPGRLGPETLRLVELYGIVALVPIWARELGRAVSISHFAQSLDGRIATATGDSRWIGDMENRVHAHRMRALCDAILVGAGTLRRDRPQLTVRHVEGADPVRVFLGASARDLDLVRGLSPAPIWSVGQPGLEGVKALIEVSEGERVDPTMILSRLYEEGASSVYIEGGMDTTSTFLSCAALDVVQLHISPIILGGGSCGFRLDGVETVAEAFRFEEGSFFSVGDGTMFVGTPRQPRGGDD